MTVTKKATFIIDGKDNTKAATDSAKRNVKAAANEMSRSMKSAGFVTDKTGRALSQLNEKTEKARQVLTTFGGAMGGAAGQAVYYGGTLCLEKDTEVMTTRGLVKIKDIRIGDTVFAYDAKSPGGVKPTRVVGVIDQGTQEVVDLIDASGAVVETPTLNHRWLTSRGVASINDIEGNTIEIRRGDGFETLTFDREATRREHCLDLSIDTEDNLYLLASGLVTHNSYIIGRFSFLELGIMAGVAAVAAIGVALYNSLIGPLNDAQEALGKTIEEVDKLTSSTADLLEKLELTKLGFTDADFAVLKHKRKRTELLLKIAGLEDKLADQRTSALKLSVVMMLKEDVQSKEQLARAEARLEIIKDQITALEKLAEAEKLPALVPIGTEEAKGRARGFAAEAERFRARKERERQQEAAEFVKNRAAREKRAQIMADWEIEWERKEAARKERALTAEAARLLRHHNHLADLEAAARKKSLALEKKQADDLARIQEEQMKKREQSIQNQLALAEQSIGIASQIGDMFDLWGVSAAKSEREREKAEAKRIATISALNMALEIARAAAAYPNIPEMAAHALAATLFAVSLGKAVASLSGAGAGGGGAGAGGGRARTPDITTREEAEQEAKQGITINVFGHQIFGRDGDRIFWEGVRDYDNAQRPGRDREAF